MEKALLFDNLIKKLDELSSTSLSFNENEVVKFLKTETKKQRDLLKQFEDSISAQKWDEALASFILLTQRVNIIFIYIFQPANISLLTSDSKVSPYIEEYLSLASLVISSSILELRPNLKKIGVESINASISANPPSLSVSMVVKSE
ncbi:hypothetical protein [Stygiolobus caldivivus]|uniref:Uncharacterized protein n=1 Tax=Stygiolobus caldivivus TaxID=2824673 RepID=A0A8D5U588_9CREN|nr:hypothetical protein [Stygiolobus caldivivus]BCU69492.1 hypothetical protein KN1_07890 [Stygiolobus caldivivus]